MIQNWHLGVNNVNGNSYGLDGILLLKISLNWLIICVGYAHQSWTNKWNLSTWQSQIKIFLFLGRNYLLRHRKMWFNLAATEREKRSDNTHKVLQWFALTNHCVSIALKYLKTFLLQEHFVAGTHAVKRLKLRRTNGSILENMFQSQNTARKFSIHEIF